MFTPLTVLIVSVAVSVSATNPRDLPQVAGQLGKSATLRCDVQRADPPSIRWTDTAYMTRANSPTTIFDSSNNPTFSIDADHQNRDDYQINHDNHDLTISRLTRDDVGAYTCSSDVDGVVHNTTYYLVVHDVLKCFGGTQLNEGDETKLTCQTAFSGQNPKMKWLRAGEPVPFKDNYKFVQSSLSESGPQAQIEATMTATHLDDGVTYRCDMKFADKHDNCSLLLNVSYAVRDLVLAPNMATHYIGEVVRCEARGNPRPDVKVIPPNRTVSDSNSGSSSFKIPDEWLGKNVTVQCEASNTHKRIKRALALRQTFLVTEKPASASSSSPCRHLANELKPIIVILSTLFARAALPIVRLLV